MGISKKAETFHPSTWVKREGCYGKDKNYEADGNEESLVSRLELHETRNEDTLRRDGARRRPSAQYRDQAENSMFSVQIQK
jgi:hypothetical protein